MGNLSAGGCRVVEGRHLDIYDEISDGVKSALLFSQKAIKFEKINSGKFVPTQMIVAMFLRKNIKCLIWDMFLLLGYNTNLSMSPVKTFFFTKNCFRDRISWNKCSINYQAAYIG